MARPAWERIDLRRGPEDRRLAILPLERGAFFDRPKIQIPRGGLVDGLNVRLERGTITNENCGYQPFPFNGATQLNLEQRAVLLIATHQSRLGARSPVFGTDRDLYRYDPATDDVQYLNPRYETGTVTIVGTTATFSTNIQTAGVKIGDYLHRSVAGQTGTPVSQVPVTDWTRITNVAGAVATLASAPGNVAGVAFTIRKVFTGTTVDVWDSEMFPDAPSNKDLLFGTNGIDDIWKWDGLADQVTLLPALGFKCRTLTRASNAMLYGYIIESGNVYPYDVRTSAIADPENVSTLEAKQLTVGRNVAPILGLRRLGENVVAYKGGDDVGSVHLLEFVGAPIYWAERTVFDNRGPRSMRSVAVFPNYHEFLAHDQAYRFDGSTQPVPLAPQMLRAVAQAFDSSRAEQAIAYVCEEYGEVFWIYPSATDVIPSGLTDAYPMQAVITHYIEEQRQSLGRFVAAQSPAVRREVPPVTAVGAVYRVGALRFSDLPAEWAVSDFPFNDRFFSGVYPQMVMGDAQGNLWIGNLSAAKGSAAMESFARFGRYAGDGSSGQFTGIVKRVYPMLSKKPTAAYSVLVRTYATDYADGDAVLRNSKGITPTLDKTIGPSHVRPNVHARYYEIEIYTNGANFSWRLGGVLVDWELSGQRGSRG